MWHPIETLESRTMLSVNPVPDPGSTMATAYNAGSVDGGKSYKNSVGVLDSVDFYKFKASSAGKVTLNLTRMTRDADLRVYNSNGVVVGSSINAGTADDKLTLNLTPNATYYAKVSYWGTAPKLIAARPAGPQPATSATFFAGVLSVPAGPLPIVSFPAPPSTSYVLTMTGIDKAANTAANGQNLGDITYKTVERTDFVGSTDTVDYYRFTINSYQNINIKLTNLTANADLQVLNANGQPLNPLNLTKSSNAGKADEVLSFGTHANTFVIKVTRVSGDTNYDLVVKATDPFA